MWETVVKFLLDRIDSLPSLPRRIRADHTTIAQPGCYGGGGMESRFYARVRLAPSRRIHRRDYLNVEQVKRFVDELFPGVFPEEASYSDGAQAFFQVRGSDREPIVNAVQVWSSGAICVRWPLQPVSLGDSVILSVNEISDVVWRVAQVVHQGGYRRLFRRRLSRKLDWDVGVSPDVLSADGSRMPWNDLSFEGTRPGGRATDQQPTFGGVRILSQPERTRPESIAAGAIAAFLGTNGYRGIDPAIRDLTSGRKRSERAR